MREAGLIVVADPGSDGPLLEAPTLQCCHCGRHFIMRRRSKTLRGFCTRCHGVFCGPQCEKCVPTEQLIENIELGRPRDFRPVVVGAPQIGLREWPKD